ncbi:6558_t:CDS:2 [Funneliformis geosporum]|uniref:12817_t:CDS:1 n=1 Tax=Funneliformis geosporum TaxID=1117311 RepID=A0A9W4SI03_9GLOM|nr:6558_t:CDS:2 [Funneliformis geosporum]CAI2167726.1 12817_t:CDS:2 [Funneliformis geosporum]
MEKEKRVKLEERSGELSPMKTPNDGNSKEDCSKKRHYAASTSTNLTFSDRNKKFGYGPPFLFSLPEPIKSPWKRLNSPNFGKLGARMISGNALKRREEKKRKHIHPFANENMQFTFPKEDTGDAKNSNNNKLKSEDRSGHDFARHINLILDMTPKIFIVVLLYYILQFSWAIQQAIEIKADEYSQELQRSISDCSKSYLENRCTPGDRVPALEGPCTQWEKYPLIKIHINFLARATISAEVLGEIINNLMEQFSYKTMFFMAAIVLVIFVIRALVDMIKTRISNNYSHPETPHPIMHSIPISPEHMTPIRHMSPGSPQTPQQNNVGVYYVLKH